MSGTRYQSPYAFYVDGTGTPYLGGKLYFYTTGTSTPQTTWSDAALSVPNTNPVIANAAGTFGSIFLGSTAYKVILTDSNDVQVWTADPVGASTAAAPATGLIVGEVRTYAGTVAPPAQWLLCYGQAISRTTYALLFNAIGTAWGVGDGTTTFNVPDLRGRVMVGRDNMGVTVPNGTGTAAGRVTAGVSGLAATVMGAVGGDQSLASHTHTVTDPGHTHTIQNALLNSGGAGNTVAGGIIQAAMLTTDSSVTGITIANSGTGTTANIQPAAILNMMIFAGV